MAERGKKTGAGGEGLGKFKSKPKAPPRAEVAKVCSINLDVFGAGEFSSGNLGKDKEPEPEAESMDSVVKILPSESEREKPSEVRYPKEAGKSELGTLRSDQPHDEPSYSVSDIVNYASIEDKAPTLRFLKDKGTEEEGGEEKEKDELGSVDIPDINNQPPPPAEEDNKDSNSENSEQAKETEQDPPKEEPEHLQEVRASQVEDSRTETVSKQSYTLHEERHPTVEENDVSVENVSKLSSIEKKKPPLPKSRQSEEEKKPKENVPEPKKSKPTASEQKIYETYEDFLESLKSSEPEPKAVHEQKKPDPLPAPSQQPPQKKEKEEDIKNKVLAKEKARLEAKERQKRLEIEEIKRKAKEKELIIERNVAATTIQKNFRRFVAEVNWKARRTVMIEEMKKKEEEDKGKERRAGRRIVRAMLKWREHKKAETEDLLKKYMGHCATLIQKLYKGYKIRARHGSALKANLGLMQLRRALLRGWKTRKVIRCEKLVSGRQTVIELCEQIENGGDSSSAPDLKRWKFQRKKAVEEFVRSFYRMYQSGRWLVEREGKAKPQVRAKTKDRDVENSEAEVEKENKEVHEEEVRPRREDAESIQNEEDNNNIEEAKPRPDEQSEEAPQRSDSENFEDMDEAPAKAKTALTNPVKQHISAFSHGKKPETLPDDRPIKPSNDRGYNIEEVLAKDNTGESPTNNPPAPKVAKKQNFLKRRNVYDPRKAIIEASKKPSADPKEDEEPPAKAKPKQKPKKEEATGDPKKAPLLQLSKLEPEDEEDKDNEKEKGTQRAQSKASSRTPIKGEERRGESEARTSQKLEEFSSEQAESNSKKPPKDFLKRRTKKVVSQKIHWGKVAKRIDCWNPKQKELSPKQAEKKKMLVRAKEAVLPAHRGSKKNTRRGNVEGPKSAQKAKRGRNPRQQQRNAPRREEADAEKLSVQELTNVYLLYHGDNQDIDTYFERDIEGSQIPVMRPQAKFFKCYTDDTYENILNDLRGEYSQLCMQPGDDN